MDGFIIYRSYYCGGSDKRVWYPEAYVTKTNPNQKYTHTIRLADEPAGCAYRYQVSAFGRYDAFILVHFSSQELLNSFIKITLSQIDGVRQIETFYIAEMYKGYGVFRSKKE